MLLSAVSVLVVAQSSSEIPEGLTNTAYVYRVAMKVTKRMGKTKFSGWIISRSEKLT